MNENEIKPVRIEDEIIFFGEKLKNVIFEMRKYKSELFIKKSIKIIITFAEPFSAPQRRKAPISYLNDISSRPIHLVRDVSL